MAADPTQEPRPQQPSPLQGEAAPQASKSHPLARPRRHRWRKTAEGLEEDQEGTSQKPRNQLGTVETTKKTNVTKVLHLVFTLLSIVTNRAEM